MKYLTSKLHCQGLANTIRLLQFDQKVTINIFIIKNKNAQRLKISSEAGRNILLDFGSGT